MILALHSGLAIILLSTAKIEPSKQPVFMEVLMLSVPNPATQAMDKVASPIIKEPVIPPPIIKKPAKVSIKKPVVIIPAVPKISSQVTITPVPVEKAEPPSVSVAQETKTAQPSAEAVAKNTGPSTQEHDADKKPVISGIMPLIKVNPIYPNRAASHDIEGWVRVEFTILADGSVADAIVVQSMPEAVFDDAALAAIEQWQFKPKMVNGIAVPQRAGQQLQFKLDR
jgi:TonB family protein